MNVPLWLLSQLFSYSPLTWLTLIAIAFYFARWAGLLGMFAAHLLTAVLIVILDVRWVTTAMRTPDWDGTPDLDVVFHIGVLARILLINTVLIPISVWALSLRRRERSRTKPS